MILAYDGTHYLGWQKTKNGPSIELTLQCKLEQILQEPIQLQAASRTDAGVHAKGQVVNFLTHKETLDFSKLRYSLNQMLSREHIVVLQLEQMPQSFHPTLNCTSKEYHYFICLGSFQYPHFRSYSWHCPYSLHVHAMKEAADYLVGEQDFSAFCNARNNNEYTSTIRNLSRVKITPVEQNRLRIEIEGNHFLYKMARNIVGTLVAVGKGQLQPKYIPDIIASKDRKRGGVSAPAHGLFLVRVCY